MGSFQKDVNQPQERETFPSKAFLRKRRPLKKKGGPTQPHFPDQVWKGGGNGGAKRAATRREGLGPEPIRLQTTEHT